MLGNRIRELRNLKDITQEDLSKIIGVTTSMVGMYETDARNPSYEVLKKIADYFEVTTDYLLGRTEEPTHSGQNATMPIKRIPERFTSPEEARAYVEKHVILGANGINPYKFDDEKILEFANEMLEQMKLISYKYKK